MKPLGYFYQFPQGEALVTEFGDYNIDGLEEADQAALLVVLSAVVFGYVTVFDPDEDRPIAAVYNALQSMFVDGCTSSLDTAIEILEGISKDQAIGLIAFLTQS